MTEIIKLQRLQNRAAKIILQVPNDTSKHVVLNDLKWFYLTERIFYHRCVFMYINVLMKAPLTTLPGLSHLLTTATTPEGAAEETCKLQNV